MPSYNLRRQDLTAQEYADLGRKDPGVMYFVDGVQKSIGDSTSTSGAVFVPAMPTTEGIQAAIQQAVSAGGGDVQLPYQSITLTGSLVLANGVRLVGAGFEMSNYADPDYVAGTRLVGNGTFPLVVCNGTDTETPMAPGSGVSQNLNLMVMSTGCIRMCLDFGTYGLKVGGKNQVGAGYSDFHDLLILRNTVTGAHFENCARLNLHHLTIYNNKHGFAYGTSSNGVWNWGNQRIDSIVGGNNTGLAFRMFARAGSELNNVVTNDIGFAGSPASHVQIDHTATMTSGNINITVPDVTVFEPGIAFLCNTNGSGFTSGRTHYVLSRSVASGPGTIQVALKPGGTPISPTGVGPITFRTRGWQVMELMGEGTGVLTFCSFMSANDVEYGGAPRVSLGGLKGCLIQLGIFGGDSPNVSMRSVDNQTTLIVQQQCTIDSDSPWHHIGSRVNSPWIGPGAGLFVTDDGRGALVLGGSGVGGNTLQVLGAAYNRLKVHRHYTGGQEISNGATLSGSNEVNLTYNTDSVGGSFTLHGGFGGDGAMIGFDYHIANPTANPITINVGASNPQIYGNGAAPANSYTLPAWTNASIRLQRKAGTYLWAVFS